MTRPFENLQLYPKWKCASLLRISKESKHVNLEEKRCQVALYNSITALCTTIESVELLSHVCNIPFQNIYLTKSLELGRSMARNAVKTVHLIG